MKDTRSSKQRICRKAHRHISRRAVEETHAHKHSTDAGAWDRSVQSTSIVTVRHAQAVQFVLEVIAVYCIQKQQIRA